ncbi:hypothetical protein [Hufsiella ginkgonis]|uniref:Uncharacterized protein n=1 Tax=Hufsiella ginkgonis TaxID=2695274 RepID=A0A7K1Y0X1_9SPHI|nr:hypothetical protein [Hufsiella ginkgonis]MXV16885.1 hypothetical protein [Hufsiella ginkgonis]
MALALSILALLATFYQAYLQRVHNAKSLKPLIQIDVMDRKRVISVLIRNNGVGPFIIKNVSFTTKGKHFSELEECLNLNPRSYQHYTVSETVDKVIQSGQSHIVFSTEFEPTDTGKDIDNVRDQLSTLELKVEGIDVYDNKIVAVRNLLWFNRKKGS